jgi:hypothetical protein
MASRLYYDIQRGANDENVWSVLATTERWISEILANTSKDGSTPLSRKEVSYVCEISTDAAMVLASIFRKLKEARQLGETHGEEQEEFLQEMGEGVYIYFFIYYYLFMDLLIQTNYNHLELFSHHHYVCYSYKLMPKRLFH